MCVVIIVHGMVEHCGNYEELARSLSQAGYAVVKRNLRGSGYLPEVGIQGKVDPETGWQDWIDDLKVLVQESREIYPGRPIFMFGHSMGSYLVQDLVATGVDVRGMILSGSSYESPALLRAGYYLAKFLAFFQGEEAKGWLFYGLTFGVFNWAFRPNRTAFDWLSRDPDFVDRYVADRLCGFVPPLCFYQAFFKGFALCYGKRPWKRISSRVGVYVFSGERDPLGKFTRSVQKLVGLYRQNGVNVTEKFYSGGRHVMLGEVNRDEVIRDIITWLDLQRMGA